MCSSKKGEAAVEQQLYHQHLFCKPLPPLSNTKRPRHPAGRFIYCPDQPCHPERWSYCPDQPCHIAGRWRCCLDQPYRGDGRTNFWADINNSLVVKKVSQPPVFFYANTGVLHPRSPVGSLQYSPIPLVGQEGCLLPHPSQGGNANSGLHLLHNIIIIWLHHFLFAFVTTAIPSCWEMVLLTKPFLWVMKLQPFHSTWRCGYCPDILLGDGATVQTSCLEMGLLSRPTITLKDEGIDQTTLRYGYCPDILLGDGGYCSDLLNGATVQTNQSAVG